VKFTLQVSSRTESFNASPVMTYKGPQYYLRVQARGQDNELTEPFTMKVTKEEFDSMPPGHVFVGELTPFPRSDL
jgi:hypothetical protein